MPTPRFSTGSERGWGAAPASSLSFGLLEPSRATLPHLPSPWGCNCAPAESKDRGSGLHGHPACVWHQRPEAIFWSAVAYCGMLQHRWCGASVGWELPSSLSSHSTQPPTHPPPGQAVGTPQKSVRNNKSKPNKGKKMETASQNRGYGPGKPQRGRTRTKILGGAKTGNFKLVCGFFRPFFGPFFYPGGLGTS